MLAWLASIALNAPLVILDPGHGGEELGASSVCGLLEKNVTLDLAVSESFFLKRDGSQWR